jgi:hypothetical protein
VLLAGCLLAWKIQLPVLGEGDRVNQIKREVVEVFGLVRVHVHCVAASMRGAWSLLSGRVETVGPLDPIAETVSMPPLMR